jgi:hypothetical protein
MIESLRKQFFEGAGAKDMKLVTTRASEADAEDRQNIINNILIKNSSAGQPAELIKHLSVCFSLKCDSPIIFLVCL